MTIDISPEAVEHLCAIHEGSEQHGIVATLRALLAALADYQRGQTYRYLGKNGLPILARDLEDQRDAAIAALTASKAETAAAYELAAGVAWEYRETSLPPSRIRALTHADSKAALDRMIAEARAAGLQEAAKIADECSETAVKKLAETNSTGERLVWWIANARSNMARDLILAAIPKGKDHE